MDLRRRAVMLLVVCALVLPFLVWGFRTYQLAFAATHAIAILGLNLIAGQAGLISLGHGAFYGLGAYTLAVLMRHGERVRLRRDLRRRAGVPGRGIPLRTRRVAARPLLPRARHLRLALAMPQMLKSSYLAPLDRRRAGPLSRSAGSTARPAAESGSMVVLRHPRHPRPRAVDDPQPRGGPNRPRDPGHARSPHRRRGRGNRRRSLHGPDLRRRGGVRGRRRRARRACSSTSSRPRASPTGSRSSCSWARCSAA